MNLEKGGQGRANFCLKLLVKMKKKIELEFQTKIGFPLASFLAPLFQIRKVWTFSLLWKNKNECRSLLRSIFRSAFTETSLSERLVDEILRMILLSFNPTIYQNRDIHYKRAEEIQS